MVLLHTVAIYEEEVLTLSKISRSDMGAYLCIASNGVPPSVSKRIMIKVHCEFNPSILSHVCLVARRYVSPRAVEKKVALLKI